VHRLAAFLAVALVLLAIGFTPLNVAATPSVPTLDHVFVIVMENHSYSEVIGNGGAPYINGLLGQAALASNYYGVAHPSLPNYLALTGASTFNVTSDCTTCWVNATNLADRVESAGRTWKAYMESMPSPCFVGDSYPYAQKHDPFIYYNDIRTNASRCQSHVVPYTQLSSDLASSASTPSFAWITPDMCNDMHDCSVAQGDVWLEQQVPVILGSPAFKNERSLLAITWDEDDSSQSNQVPAIFVGSDVLQNRASATAYNHYSLLHTIETALGLQTMSSNDAGAATMNDLFASTATTCIVTITANTAQPNADFTASVSDTCPTSDFQVAQFNQTLGQGWFSVADVPAVASNGTWTATPSIHGYPGNTYQLKVRAHSGSSFSSWTTAATTSVNSGAAFTRPFKGVYTIDAYGGLSADSSAPLATSAYWAGWSIARSGRALPGSFPQSGAVLDDFGGLHPYGAPITISGGPYWKGWDIARDFAFLPAGTGGYVLDGFGGLHPFSVNGATPPPAVTGAAYWAGNDVARRVVIFSDGTGGYVMDAFGGLHPFGIGHAAPAAATGAPYWPGWAIARDVVLVPGTHAGYVLDGWGGVHPFSGAPAAAASAYWPHWDIARGIWLLPGSSLTAASGYVMDGYGGLHPLGGAAAIPSYAYFPGSAIARMLAGY
jgi:acid phosphatase